jgi:hypothetical protein
MHRSYKTALAALQLIAFQLIALQLFVALACASAASTIGPRAARTPDSTAYGLKASHLRTPDPLSVQRRRGRLRLDALSPGTWGGDHMRFEVTEGGAKIDLDCAHASVEGKIKVDRAGRFNVWGTYYQEHGGPVREEEEARGERVRLTGRVGGSLMKLTVTRGATQVGTYTLTRDREARVIKCR